MRRIAVLTSLALSFGCRTSMEATDGAEGEPPSCCRPPILEATTRAPSPEERFGVRVESVRPSAADTLIDVRLRVLDPELAAPLFSRDTPARLVFSTPSGEHQAEVPRWGKVGSLRQTLSAEPPTRDRIYFLLFANPARSIRPTDEVHLEIGPYRSSPLRVLGPPRTPPPGEGPGRLARSLERRTS